MLSITSVEFLTILSSIIAGLVIIMFISESFENIETVITRLKTDKKYLEKRIEELEEENKILTNNTTHDKDLLSDANKTKILIKENRKLHVRCDMLEEELKKMSENKEMLLFPSSNHIHYM
jgi:cell division protein FtsB